MDNPCNLCQYFEKNRGEKPTVKTEISLADLSSLRGRVPFTDGKISAASRIAGFCVLRRMYVAEETMNKGTCMERANITSGTGNVKQ